MIGFFFFWVVQGFAAEVVLQADTTRLQEGQSVQVHVTVVDGQPRSQPQLPLPEGLTAVFRGQRQSMTMGTGGSSRTLTYTWQVTALATGSSG